VSRRALPGIAVMTLFLAACGEVIQIGDEGDVAVPSPPDVCSTLKCGDSCPLATACTNTDCPPSVGGFCDLDRRCVLDQPVCPGPGSSSCAGIACGLPCGSCDPDSPGCDPVNPSMVCDAFQQCQAGPITFTCL
jgi:hypothetical protein